LLYAVTNPPPDGALKLTDVALIAPLIEMPPPELLIESALALIAPPVATVPPALLIESVPAVSAPPIETPDPAPLIESGALPVDIEPVPALILPSIFIVSGCPFVVMNGFD